MDIAPQIFTARVMHHRLFPRENSFNYKTYFLALPVPCPPIQQNFISFEKKDIGFRDGRDPEDFVREILARYGFEEKISAIMLLTIPKVLGYIFNPVSFYLCFDTKKHLRGVVAEVHNTFGEQHAYFCAHPDGSIIFSHQWLEAKKAFHVSPFLEREGSYRFRFSLEDNQLGIWIDYYDKNKEKKLITSLVGSLYPLEKKNLNKIMLSSPFMTFKIIFLIYWQALKIFCKNKTYVKKPLQKNEKITASFGIESQDSK